MSATGRNLAGSERRADDFYATPSWVTMSILGHLTRSTVMDPCCGEGAILDVVASHWAVGTYGMDLDNDRALAASRLHASSVRDALTDESWSVAPGCCIITNPPYSLAMEFVKRAAIECPSNDRAFMLRINFLGSQRRSAWLRENTPDVYVLPKRPSFTNGGTDATEYAWMVWGPGRTGRIRILEVP